MSGQTDLGGRDCLTFIINHVFLPPKLPQEAEEDVLEKNSALLKLVWLTAEIYRENKAYPPMAHIVQMLSNLYLLENNNSLSAKAFINAVACMKTGGVLALYISAQNAGLILRQFPNQMVFESFEASPMSSDVIGSKAKLRCSYPGPAITVDLDKAKDPTFLAELASFIDKMKRDVLEQATPKSSKAGSKVSEERETAQPKFITEMLTGILRAIGSPAETSRIQKRIADDVLWDNAKIPWRRSPIWLVVRVALQTSLKSSTGSHPEMHAQYKAFMIFLMTRILDLALQEGLTNDVLFTMNAKLSRRVYKAHGRIPEFVLEKALEVGKRTCRLLHDRWAQTQKDHSGSFYWSPNDLLFVNDTQLTMHNSKSCLRQIMDRQSESPVVPKFQPNEVARITLSSGEMPPPSISNTSKVERDIALADFELWVRRHLDTWVAANLHREQACREIAQRIDDYTSAAKISYNSDPERTSVMVLVTMELWVALDKVTVQQCPEESRALFLDYFPEFADDLLEPLILPKIEQMARLHKVEEHLSKRRSNASRSNPSIFSAVVSHQTFTVRYFQVSSRHKQLEQEIQAQARRERDRKIIELKEKEKEYENLREKARVRTCDDYTDWRGWTRHDRYCTKCSLNDSAARMRIEVYEWPLPENEHQRMAVVFELRCPMWFSVWRDTTYKILVDVFTPPLPSSSSDEPYETFQTFAGLKGYFDSSARPEGQRLHWSSSTKSFLRSHYRDGGFPTDIDTICVNNGLKYGLFDTTGRHWLDRIRKSDIRQACTFQLPDGHYKGLQFTVNSTSQEPNIIMAKQSECPGELQLHEYLAFGLLRAGHRIQWLNIVRELRTRTLTFNSVAVNMLVMQAAWQAGPKSSGVYRESHVELRELEFGNNLLYELEDMLRSIEANWQEGLAAYLLINLATRILSLSEHEEIVQRAVKFLREARRVSLNWTRQLAERLRECKEEETEEFQRRALQMAAICRTTYYVDESYLENVLYSSEDFAVLVECATIVHDNTPATREKLPLPIHALLNRDKRLSHAVEDHLRSLILKSEEGLDLKKVWDGYKPGARWESCSPKQNDRWIFTNTAAGLGTCSQQVHYNLLDGELLVQGLPLGRMPFDYVSHPTYLELFGEKVLDVSPSKMKGMLFQTKHAIHAESTEVTKSAKDVQLGYEVGFIMKENELVIRTRRKVDKVVHEFIPRTKLKGDFPTHIIESHLHWLNISSGDLEFRDLGNLWPEKQPKNWFIPRPENIFRLGKDERLIDLRSATAAMFHTALSPLEYTKFIDIRYSSITGVVSAHLPRLKLEFFINPSRELECRQFPGMVVDNNQDIGTLVGLVNRLVVHQASVRSVIIPYGKVELQRYGNHTKVRIETGDVEKVKYHVYTIDTRLGRLVGNGSLVNHLYKIYLHAVTAYCLPDPLTRGTCTGEVLAGRTGTEEALAGLRAAITWSFQELDKKGEEADLLRLIASVTPKRVYYPSHLKVMQKVGWSTCLPAVAQHDEFHAIVLSVFTHASRFHIFQEGNEESDTSAYLKKVSDNDLLEKAAIRNACFRTEEFGGSLLGNSEDSIYSARDAIQNSNDEARTWYVSEMVARWPSKMNICPQLMDIFQGWGHLSGLGEGLKLGYDQKWLTQNLADVWCELYNVFRGSSQQQHTYQLMFLLSALAYSGKIDLRLIETLLAFATVPRFRHLTPPPYSSYNLEQGFSPKRDVLLSVVKECAAEFGGSDESSLPARSNENSSDLARRRYTTYEEGISSQSASFVDNLLSQWPCASPSPQGSSYRLLKITMAIEKAKPLFKSWYENKKFKEHVEEVQRVLNSINRGEREIPHHHYSFKTCENRQSSAASMIRLETLLGQRDPPTVTVNPKSFSADAIMVPPAGSSELDTLLKKFRSQGSTKLQQLYAEGLFKSLNALRVPSPPKHSLPTGLVEAIKNECDSYLKTFFEAILQSLMPKEAGELMLYKAGLWPRISPMSLLQLLSRTGSVKLSAEWRNVLVSYGKAITMLQRSERLLSHAPKASGERSPDFDKEAENTGHQQWDPIQKPDWLLIEIENNFLVRPVQAKIASKMISPPSNENSVMQLFMGEGKTSVIVPIVAAALADGKKLVRVVVLKPLSKQMFQMLVQKLGGLVNRRIFHMPFSRALIMSEQKARQIRLLYEECMKCGGILLVQPEHTLSFKLVGLEWLNNSKNPKFDSTHSDQARERAIAEILLDTQGWLEENSRDVLDESDEILNVRNELIYTIGASENIENYPDRWLIVQETFDLVRKHLQDGKFEPRHLEIETPPDREMCFPTVRILDLETGQAFLKKIALKIIAGDIPTVSFRLLPEVMRELATRFITDPSMSKDESKLLFDYSGKNDLSKGTLYLLRGLIAHGILLFALKEKRWRVDYGLDLKRSMLAVPYRAKDSPSVNAEFSHPDVAVTLTCLSYYYGGLTETQLETCFRNLYKSDNPTMEYERWLKGVPKSSEAFQHLNSINLQDNEQWKSVTYPKFRYNKGVIDFYLSGVVFPKEAKEFAKKLSTSAWDISAAKTHPTTGFSGTNDNQYLLPLSITQNDSYEQLNTNAKVLSYLLQPENSYIYTGGENRERFKVERLLEELKKPEHQPQIRVLLDVGAQVLELKNDEVVDKWLDIVPEAQAAVFFDNDELTVMARDRSREPLMVSAFSKQLENCLVYLDEAHTRGTDLKLPLNSRAAVTLGPNLTKDRLVQACMRMRKLGHGQSVLFCGPPEVDQKIKELSGPGPIGVQDVLLWSMVETCISARKLLPIWAKQGISYQTRFMAMDNLQHCQKFPKDLLEKESKTLEEHYGYCLKENGLESLDTTGIRSNELSKIKKMCEEYSIDSLNGAHMLEEQERELSNEVERERENQLPPKAEPLAHCRSEEVLRFIRTGNLPQNHTAHFTWAFSTFYETSAATKHGGLDVWAANTKSLLATLDFSRVINRRQNDVTDSFLRPINWILTSSSSSSSSADGPIMVLISPYEAHEFLPEIRKSSAVFLHIYSAKVTQVMQSYETLTFCAIPPVPASWRANTVLVDQLNLFAGQLYFRDHDTYERVCSFLGLYLKKDSVGNTVSVRSDGFVEPKDRVVLGMGSHAPFAESPVPFLRCLMVFRRKGQGYQSSHMGQVLYGRLLEEGDFA